MSVSSPPTNSTGVSAARAPLVLPASRRASLWTRFRRNQRALIGAAILLFFCALALLAPVIAPYPPEAQSLMQRYQGPSSAHWMGTDGFGRDILSRAIWASRVSLAIGVVSVLISIAISILVGATAGFYGGRLDNVLMRFVDMLLAFPTFFLLIAVVAAFGSQVPVLIIVLGLTSWQVGARIVRGEVLALKRRDFVIAARALGAEDVRVLMQHILPNILSVVIVAATIRVAVNILLEAGLSYLGLGVQPPMASWGNMVSEGKAVLRVAWWVTAFPGIFIFLTVMAFNLMGDGLRDALDPNMDVS